MRISNFFSYQEICQKISNHEVDRWNRTSPFRFAQFTDNPKQLPNWLPDSGPLKLILEGGLANPSAQTPLLSLSLSLGLLLFPAKPYFNPSVRRTQVRNRNIFSGKMSSMITRSRFSPLLTRHSRRFLSSDASTNSHKESIIASQSLISEQSPPPPPQEPVPPAEGKRSWKFLKYSLVAALTGVVATAGYATYGTYASHCLLIFVVLFFFLSKWYSNDDSWETPWKNFLVIAWMGLRIWQYANWLVRSQ